MSQGFTPLISKVEAFFPPCLSKSAEVCAKFFNSLFDLSETVLLILHAYLFC